MCSKWYCIRKEIEFFRIYPMKLYKQKVWVVD